jgi:hypothetical protein
MSSILGTSIGSMSTAPLSSFAFAVVRGASTATYGQRPVGPSRLGSLGEKTMAHATFVHELGCSERRASVTRRLSQLSALSAAGRPATLARWRWSAMPVRALAAPTGRRVSRSSRYRGLGKRYGRLDAVVGVDQAGVGLVVALRRVSWTPAAATG